MKCERASCGLPEQKPRIKQQLLIPAGLSENINRCFTWPPTFYLRDLGRPADDVRSVHVIRNSKAEA